MSRMRPHTKLIEVCLARNDGTGIAKFGNDSSIVGAGKGSEDRGRARSGKVSCTNIVFDSYQLAIEWSWSYGEPAFASRFQAAHLHLLSFRHPAPLAVQQRHQRR